MTQERIKINNNEFEYKGVVYDCKRAINKDVELILDEANAIDIAKHFFELRIKVAQKGE